MDNLLKKRFSLKFFKYAFIGGFVTLLDWSIFYVLSSILNVYYQLAVIISFTIGATTKFGFNKIFTFQSKYKKISLQYSVFFIVTIIGLLASVLFMYLFVDLLFIHKIISRIATTIITLFLNFFLDNYITFNKRFFNDN